MYIHSKCTSHLYRPKIGTINRTKNFYLYLLKMQLTQDSMMYFCKVKMREYNFNRCYYRNIHIENLNMQYYDKEIYFYKFYLIVPFKKFI